MRINCGIFLEAALAADDAVVSVSEICKSDKMRRFGFYKNDKNTIFGFAKMTEFLI